MHTRAPLVVGRDSELATLERTVGEATARQGQAVFLVGEPGIGKSRLALESSSKAFETGMQVLRGRGSAIGPMVPFRPLTEALLSLFRGGPPPDYPAIGPYRPALGRLIPEWGQPDAQHSGSLIVLAEAVLRLLAVVGGDRGCLLVLEDLQDADAETLAVVEYLVDNLNQQPILLLATIRAEPSAALDLAHSAARRRAGTILELGPLDRVEACRLVASCLDTEPEAVPEPVVNRLWDDSAGNPFVLEELLQGMVTSGLLVSGSGGWRVVGPLRTKVPATLVRGIAHRTDRLGPQGRMLLSVAANLGHRFPLSVVQAVTGVDDRSLLSHLHAGIAAQLVVPDQPAPDWYAFRHPLTAEALLAQLTPIDRAELSGRAADAVEQLHPDLPGEWCPLVAALRLAAGDTAKAGRLFAEAGSRALAAGAAGSAVALLDRADALLATHNEAEIRADVLVALLPALAETGKFERALQLADTLDTLGRAGLDTARRAALHTRLAKVAHLAGRWADGLAQIKKARILLGSDASDEQTAPVDTVAAFLALDSPSPGRAKIAADLARRAVVAAERVPLPHVAIQAWELLGNLARGEDLDESNRCFARAVEIAEQNQLPIARAYARVRLAGNDFLADGSIASSERAGREAMDIGAISLAYTTDSIVAMQAVLAGKHDTASHLVARCLENVTRLQLISIMRYTLVAKAALAAHQANRPEMEDALAAFSRIDGDTSPELPIALGLARVFCALLEEDSEQVGRELARAAACENANPTTFHLAGRHGLHLLLDVLSGHAGWPQFDELTAAAASRMRWNRHFVELTRAVLLGRAGRAGEAAVSINRAEQAAAIFPVAHFLGLRLVAAEAHAYGWGEPVIWLRRAEEYFHQASVSSVASACRALLRQIGAPVQQRRNGAHLVPKALRALGVTVREYDVFQLMVDRLGNKAIATRLHISPRTAEKHIASLLIKTNQPDRTALGDYALRLHEDTPSRLYS